ncbi:MAG: hypothetical protein AAF512_25105, partial [Pseudomonadota bacterium]
VIALAVIYLIICAVLVEFLFSGWPLAFLVVGLIAHLLMIFRYKAETEKYFSILKQAIKWGFYDRDAKYLLNDIELVTALGWSKTQGSNFMRRANQFRMSQLQQEFITASQAIASDVTESRFQKVQRNVVKAVKHQPETLPMLFLRMGVGLLAIIAFTAFVDGMMQDMLRQEANIIYANSVIGVFSACWFIYEIVKYAKATWHMRRVKNIQKVINHYELWKINVQDNATLLNKSQIKFAKQWLTDFEKLEVEAPDPEINAYIQKSIDAL